MKQLFLVLLFSIFNTFSVKAVVIEGKFFFDFGQEIIISRYSTSLERNVIISKCQLKEDSTFTLSFILENASLLSLNGNFIFVQPDDEVYIEYLSLNSFKVVGNYPGNYQYFNYSINIDKPSSKHISNHKELVIYSKHWVEDSLTFESKLDEFNQILPVSEDFKEYIRMYQKCFFDLSILVAMKRLSISFADTYFNKYLPIEYKGIFRDPESNPYYAAFLAYHAEVQFGIIKDEFESEFLIEKLLNYSAFYDDKDVSFLKLKMFYYICRNSIIKMEPLVSDLFFQLFATSEFSEGKITIENYYKKYLSIGSKISNNLLLEGLREQNGNEVKLESILNQAEVVFIDFWASWCGPCIAEFPAIEVAKNELKDQPLLFVSISLDTDSNIWSSACRKYGLFDNSFQILDLSHSELIKEFQINQIPRFVVLNSIGEVISSEFIAPSSPSFISKMKRVIMLRSR